MPRLEASSRASRKLPSEEYGPGMPTPTTFSLPTRVGRDDGGKRRIDTAAQSQQHAPEAAFADVVAGAEDQSFVHGLALVGEILVLVAQVGQVHDLPCAGLLGRSGTCPTGIDKHQVVAEGCGGGDDAALGIHGKTAAVEHQGVIAANLVHVDQRNPVAFGGSGERSGGAVLACPCGRETR